MVRRISVWVLGLLLIVAVGNVHAGQNIGSIRLQLYDVNNEQQHVPVTLEYNIISADVDLGSAYFTVYGALLEPSGENGIPIGGSGYFYDLYNGGTNLIIELRAGLYLYHLVLNGNSLNGTFFRMGGDGGTLTGKVKLNDFIPTY